MLAKWPDHPFHGTMKEMSEWGVALGPLLETMIAHHGRPVDPPPDPTMRAWRVVSHYDWQVETATIDHLLHRWFGGAFGSTTPETGQLPDQARFHHAVAGLVALSDWIGSDRRYFEYAQSIDPDYHITAHRAAARALAETGFDPSVFGSCSVPDFSTLTGFKPRPAQAAVGAVAHEARLVILEAETGSGKTEAALWRFMQLFAVGAVAGLYFAVPTRAAARQLHGRIDRAMRRVFGDNAPEAVLAIPGMLHAGEAEGRRLPDWNVLWEDHPDTVPARWAAEHATRFLAATVAVGTVDQIMLSALKVKHAHLRGSALSRSLLVIDEVHASDAYMTEVLTRLLDDHLAAGGYALLMSATLGSRARVKWTGEQLSVCAGASPYPAVWVKGEARARQVRGPREQKTVQLETVETMDPVVTAKHAIAEAARGARVLVIRNTVRMAVATWTAAGQLGGGSVLMQVAGCPALHHGRFAVEDRRLLDQAVESVLSIDPAREQRGCIVIGTQTLEQSLDIDADLLITDLCPIDVLLQRVGRVHRHHLPRPTGFEKARVVVLLLDGGLDRLTKPDFENGLGTWDGPAGRGGIYQDLAGLELTQRLILDSRVWDIPGMNRALVEEATHPDYLKALIAEKGEDWARYDCEEGGARAAEAEIARMNVLQRSARFEGLRFPKGDERIMTRLGEEGVLLDLQPAPMGPFEQRVTRITLPAHWSHGINDDHEVVVEPGEEGLVISVAGKRFHYGRTGLNRA